MQKKQKQMKRPPALDEWVRLKDTLLALSQIFHWRNPRLDGISKPLTRQKRTQKFANGNNRIKKTPPYLQYWKNNQQKIKNIQKQKQQLQQQQFLRKTRASQQNNWTNVRVKRKRWTSNKH